MKQEPTKVPQCVGMILDGNRRWAKARGIPKLEGHRAGYEKLKETARWAFEAGVKTLLVYAFSTENWQREADEVSYLMQLLKWALQHEVEIFMKEETRVRIIGDRARFSEDIQTLMRRVEEKTAQNKKGTIGILLSYGGRAEIVSAAKELARSAIAPDAVTEEEFSKHLWTAGIPDPDLIIRTGGVMRLSNFLTWQSVYSELFFLETLWPDFTKEEFTSILSEYAERERRFGK